MGDSIDRLLLNPRQYFVCRTRRYIRGAGVGGI